VKRRDFIALLGGSAAWPLAARAQPAKIPLVGILDAGIANLFAAFLQRMRELGYIEGQNVSYLHLSADGRPDRVPQLATELIASKPDLIVTAGPLPVRALQDRTSAIPIVFAALGDAVGSGAVSSLARPGRNLTGLSFLNTEISAKRLELLRDTLPDLRRVSVLRDTNSPRVSLDATVATAQRLGIELQLLEVKELDDFETGFRAAAAWQAQAMNILASPFFNSHRLRLVELAAKYVLPAMYENGDYVRDGGLMAYGPSLPDLFQRAAAYVDKILNGAKPADLPVEQPTKFEFVVNLKSAKAIGLEVPVGLLLRADEVVE